MEKGFFIGIGCYSIPFFLVYFAKRSLPVKFTKSKKDSRTSTNFGPFFRKLTKYIPYDPIMPKAYCRKEDTVDIRRAFSRSRFPNDSNQCLPQFSSTYPRVVQPKLKLRTDVNCFHNNIALKNETLLTALLVLITSLKDYTA